VKKDIFLYRSGASYEGEWLDEQKHGYGVMIWPDSTKYEGKEKINNILFRAMEK
jgi:L1 cell adhesion molecule like protein